MDQTLQRIARQYEIVAKIKEGGMGEIYKVRHKLLDEMRVVKVLHPHYSDDAQLSARFAQEARAAIQLRHPNIVQIFDFTVDDESGTGLIVMELIRGVDLRQLLRRKIRPSTPLLLEIARQSLRALSYLHRQGFVHRDVSPDNLMLSLDVEGGPLVKLIDLGIAKRLDSPQLTASGLFLGKYRYASPEHFGTQGTGGVEARSDLYTFGLVLYELATGHYPFEAKATSELIAAHLYKPPRDFAETDAGNQVPDDLRQLLLRSLAKAPDERHASAHELIAEIEQLQRHHPLDAACRDEARQLTEVVTETGRWRPPDSTQERLESSIEDPDEDPGDRAEDAPADDAGEADAGVADADVADADVADADVAAADPETGPGAAAGDDADDPAADPETGPGAAAGDDADDPVDEDLTPIRGTATGSRQTGSRQTGSRQTGSRQTGSRQAVPADGDGETVVMDPDESSGAGSAVEEFRRLLAAARDSAAAQRFTAAEELAARAKGLAGNDRKLAEEAAEASAEIVRLWRRSGEIAEVVRQVEDLLARGALMEADRVLFQAAETHGSDRRLVEVREHLDELYRRELESKVRALVEQAEGEAASGDYGQALEIVRKAQAMAPADPELKKTLEESTRIYRKKSAELPRRRTEEQIRKLVRKAGIEIAAKRFSAAIEPLRRALELKPDDPWLRARLREAEVEQQRDEDRRQRERQTEDFLEQARQAAKRRDILKARLLVARSLELVPDHEDARMLAAELDRRPIEPVLPEAAVDALDEIEALRSQGETLRAWRRVQDAIEELGELGPLQELRQQVAEELLGDEG